MDVVNNGIIICGDNNTANNNVSIPIDLTKLITKTILEKEKTEMPKLSQGTLFLRKDGRWEGRLCYNGKQKTVKISKSKTIVYNSMRDAIREKKKISIVRNTSKKWHEWLDEWFLNKTKKQDLSDVYIKSLQNFIKLIKDNLPDRPLSKLQPLEIEVFLLLYKNKSRTAIGIYNVLKESLTHAYNMEVLKRNLAAKIEKPNYAPQRGNAMTLEQESEFLKAIKGNRSELFFKFYLYTGIRKSELFMISWLDIDLANKIMTIKGTKNKTSNRMMPLYQKLIDVISNIDKNGNMICNLSETTVCKRDFEEVRKKLSFDLTIKDLRHTFATRCHQASILPLVYSKWMGHSDTTMVEKVYTHIQDSQSFNEIKKLN